MNTRLALLLGSVVGFAAATGVSCGTKPLCSVTNCATGCCDKVTGNCVSVPTAQACGINGNSCNACQLGQVCLIGTCSVNNGAGGSGVGGSGVGGGNGGGSGGGGHAGGSSVGGGSGGGTASCSTANCLNGCCQGTSCVVAGTSNTACGTFATSCTSCALGQTCNSSGQCVTAPPSCSASNCSGCCSGTTCLPGTMANACGTFGAACTSCQANGQVCQQQQCVSPPSGCNPTTCPAGCCSFDTCVVAGTDNSACGYYGSACGACASGQYCGGQGQCYSTNSCRAVTASGFTRTSGAWGSANTVYIGVKTSPSASAYNLLRYEAWMGAGFPNPTGTRAFSDAGYDTCAACMVYAENCTEDGGCGRFYLATSGSMTVSSGTQNSSAGNFSASVSNVRFVELNVSTSQPNNNSGPCLTLVSDSASFSWP